MIYGCMTFLFLKKQKVLTNFVRINRGEIQCSSQLASVYLTGFSAGLVQYLREKKASPSPTSSTLNSKCGEWSPLSRGTEHVGLQSDKQFFIHIYLTPSSALAAARVSSQCHSLTSYP